MAAGSLAELAAHAGPPQIRFGAPAGLAPDVLTGLSAALAGAVAREVAPGEYVVDADPSPANVAQLTAWLAHHDLPLGDLRAGRQRLEDVFLRLTGPATPGRPTPPGADRPASRATAPGRRRRRARR